MRTAASVSPAGGRDGGIPDPVLGGHGPAAACEAPLGGAAGGFTFSDGEHLDTAGRCDPGRGGAPELLAAVVDDRLEEVQIDWDPRPAVCVVMAAGGYPGKYETGHVIEGLERAEQMPDVCVFHAGTREVEHMTVTAGGRVLGVTALGDDLAAAQRRAYEAVRMIRFQNAHYRRDIAAKALAGHARAAN